MQTSDCLLYVNDWQFSMTLHACPQYSLDFVWNDLKGASNVCGFECLAAYEKYPLNVSVGLEAVVGTLTENIKIYIKSKIIP